MKKLLFFVSLLFINYSNAQTNLGFESWTGASPDDWYTSNQIMAFGGPQTIFKDSINPGYGLYAAQMTVEPCGVCSIFGYPDPFPGLLLQQHADTMRPVNVSFKWHGSIATGDTALIGCAVTLAGAQVGDAFITITPTTQATWKTENILFTYYNSNIPDTMTFGAITDQFMYYGVPGSANTATELYVDEFVVNGISGIGLIPTNNDLLFIYPNPAQTSLHLNLLGTDAYSLEILDVTGKAVYSLNNLLQKQTLDISRFKNGSYIMRFFNRQKQYVGTTRFVVAN
ncbi:MAG TPA: T9SS type A sorting domain-containing protein [Flavobacteriales bacterium]|nr:T9SS type A sorting domain-containing protein [Flavobacteriales bacterium]